jgi:glutaminyl-peptide cyclotransferase
MKTDIVKCIIFPFVLILLTWTLSCSGRSGTENVEETPPVIKADDNIEDRSLKILSPEQNAGFKLNEAVNVVLELSDKKKLPDSVQIVFDGVAVKTINSEPWEYSIPAANTVTTGRKSLKITAFRGGRSQRPITRFVIIYSDVIPERYGYRVINSYPHDRKAFTQGLIFEDGKLYESTGQETASSVREVDLKTGKVVRQFNLETSLFGEGITIWRDRIYHVTWTNRVGFILEKSTFRVISKFYYQSQGWGLTTIDDVIIMSDGTNILSFFEPESFTAVGRLEVYDNEKKVDSLNELEYINGEIWANIWMTDLIARIDPLTGKVLGYIDLRGLLPESEQTPDTDVLNGIAYDREGNRIFVTGKKWPRLYEIAITR